MTPTELDEILRLHKLWLNDEEGGQRANLTEANLGGADLTRANLAGSNLTEANFTGANLGGASLGGADFAGANLTGASLVRADLSGANLTGADLTRTNLTRANFDATTGIKWAAIGPVGKGRRLLSAWAHPSLPEPIIGGGCFRGTFSEFRSAIAGEPWDWSYSSPADIVRWRAECSVAADYLELAVTIHTARSALASR